MRHALRKTVQKDAPPKSFLRTPRASDSS
jgi:hypothetical protein